VQAEAEFGKERSCGTSQLYGPEFVMNACDGGGFAKLRAGDPAGAVPHFTRALELFPEHARSLAGLGAALSAAGTRKKADAAFERCASAIAALRKGGRSSEATIAQAFLHTATGRHTEALECLRALLERADLPFTGWTIPVEPLLEPLRGQRGFQDILQTLAVRAR
jgi:tetratricopeptide (TPR) repeat protein